MLRFLIYIMFVVGAIYVTLLYMYIDNYQPEAMDKFLLKVDVLGVTDLARKEQGRLAQIRNLTIHYEEKQVLINHTVFMGATPEMVRLALDEPQKTVDKDIFKYYVYYLPNDNRPTVLVFKKEDSDSIYKLVKAYKGSAIDFVNSELDQK